MSQPVNLNRFRKQKARAENKARANENTVKFGRTKSEKQLTKAQNDKANAHVDGHKRDTP